MKQKLSVYLGLREKVESQFKNMNADMVKKFKDKPALFRGLKNTFQAFDGFVDQPEKRAFTLVSSTVTEQLDWFKEHTKDYFDVVFSIEKTNAIAQPKAELVVEGESWGEYTTLELLRLKGVLDSTFRQMISILPVRDETKIWTKTSDTVYTDRDVFETPLEKGNTKTTRKESYILPDPHIKEAQGRAPQVSVRDIQEETGSYTKQEFSGEISMRERATKLAKLDALYKAIVAALESANDTEVVKSDLGTKAIEYLL